MTLKKGKLVRGIFAGLVLLLAACMMLSGCREKAATPKFEKNSINDDIRIGVKSEIDTFDIDNVTFDLYYGFWDIDYHQKYRTDPTDFYIFSNMGDDLVFGMYFCDSESYNDVHNNEFISDYMNIEGHYFIKSILEEDAFSEEYGYKKGYRYNHGEKITVPKEQFSKENGYLVIKIIGFQEPLTPGDDYYTSNKGYIDLKYQLIDENMVRIDFSPYRDLY